MKWAIVPNGRDVPGLRGGGPGAVCLGDMELRVRNAVIGIVLISLVAWTSMGAAGAAATNDYRIRVGDTLSVTVYGEAALSVAALSVLPGGSIVVPLAGQVHVAGLVPDQAAAAVARSLARYLRDPKVTVAVALVGPVEVLVLGNVKTPGKFLLQPESRLTDALAAAGGLGPTDGDYPTARLQSSDGTVKEISLQRLLHDGQVDLNVRVSNEMTVYVPSLVTISVQIFGAVDKPGDVALHQGDRVLAAVARAGASPSLNPDLNNVMVRHVQPDGKTLVQTVNLYEIVRSRDESKDILLEKGDVVFVPQAKKHVNPGDILSTILNIRWLVP